MMCWSQRVGAALPEAIAAAEAATAAFKAAASNDKAARAAKKAKATKADKQASKDDAKVAKAAAGGGGGKSSSSAQVAKVHQPAAVNTNERDEKVSRLVARGPDGTKGFHTTESGKRWTGVEAWVVSHQHARHSKRLPSQRSSKRALCATGSLDCVTLTDCVADRVNNRSHRSRSRRHWTRRPSSSFLVANGTLLCHHWPSALATLRAARSHPLQTAQPPHLCTRSDSSTPRHPSQTTSASSSHLTSSTA